MNAALVVLTAIALGNPAKTIEAPEKDIPRVIAEQYLHALVGDGDENARQYLLGGVSLTARGFKIPNWKIVKRDPLETEVGTIPSAKVAMKKLDDAGFKALSVMASPKQRKKALDETIKRGEEFEKEHKLFAYVARTGKDIYWHPKNPWRDVARKLGNRGRYTLELHRFHVEETKNGKKHRVWPLRVLRIQGGGYDSGWKILPASDWDPDY
jgi:hypothetical protein